MENTILSIIASLLLAGITALFTYLATRSKIRLDLTAEYDKDLRTSRLKVYQDLWKLLEPIARYSRAEPVTYVVVKEIAENMRIWYFQQGGIFLTKESKTPYFSLKKVMQNIIDDEHLKEDNTGELDKKKLETLTTGASLLRNSLTEDIGSRKKSFLSSSGDNTMGEQAQPPQTSQQNAVERAQRLLQNMRQHPVWSAIIIILVIALVVSFIGGYFFNWDWTAFNGGSSKVTTTSTASGITTVTENPVSKTLWDWLQLLIVPVMLAIGGFWLNRIQSSREQQAEEQRATLAQQAEEQRATLAQQAEEQRATLAQQAEEQRAKLETQKEFMRRVRTMHATIGYARVLLNAHKSARTYVDQSQQLMRLRIDVEEISEDLGASPGLFVKQQEILYGLEGIIKYLQECEDEYEKHHNDVIHDPCAINPGDDGDLRDVVKQQGMVWVQDFMKMGKGYIDKYNINLTKAKGTMRSEVYGALQSLPVDAPPSG